MSLYIHQRPLISNANQQDQFQQENNGRPNKHLNRQEIYNLNHMDKKWISRNEELSVLKHCTSLTSLVLVYPEETLFKTLALAKANLKNLKHVEIQGNPDFEEDASDDDDAKTTEGGLAHIVDIPLESLRISGFLVKDAAMPHIGKMTSIRHLDISDTYIGDEGLSCLQNATHLKALDLCSCEKVTGKGISYLKNLNLEALFLGWTDNIKMEELLPSLLEMKKLKELDLRGAIINREQLLSLSELPLRFISLLQPVSEVKNFPSRSDLLEFALKIREKHGIDVKIINGSVLEWEELKLNKNGEFAIHYHLREYVDGLRDNLAWPKI